MWVKIDDPDRTRNSPILLAAAAACSFAIFTESMVGLRLGGTCGLSCWPLSEVTRMKNVQIRFRNKHMYTLLHTQHFDLSYRRSPSTRNPNVCNLSHQTGKPKRCGMHSISARILCKYSEFLRARISYYSWSWILYVSTVILSTEATNLSCRPHTRKSRNRPKPPQNLCVSIYIYMTSEYRRISFAEIYSKPPSPMQCSHSPGPMKLLVNQLAWPCISSIFPHGQVDQDYT